MLYLWGPDDLSSHIPTFSHSHNTPTPQPKWLIPFPNMPWTFVHIAPFARKTFLPLSHGCQNETHLNEVLSYYDLTFEITIGFKVCFPPEPAILIMIVYPIKIYAIHSYMIYVCGYVFKCSIACNSKTLETTEIDATLKKGRYTFIHTLTENWLLNVGCDF